MEIVKSNKLIKWDVKPVFEYINTACDQLKCSKIVAKVFAYIGYSFSVILPLTDLCILLGNMCSLKSTSSLSQVDGPQVDGPQGADEQEVDEQEVDEQEVDEQVAGPQSTGARLYPPRQTGDQAALTRVLGQWTTSYAPDISAMMAKMLGIDTNPARPLATTFSLNLEYALSGVLIDNLDVPLQTECSRYDFIVRALLGRPDFSRCSGFLFFSPDRKELTVDEINNMEVSPGRHMPLAFIPVEDQELIDALHGINNERIEGIYNLSDRLKDNKSVVLAALRKRTPRTVFKWASSRLRADLDVTLAAVTRNGWDLMYADSTLQNNFAVVLAAVTQNGFALEYANEDLRNNLEIVLAAVTQNAYALQYANEDLRNNLEIVLAAVSKTSSALEYASESLRGEKKVVLAAISADSNAVRCGDAIRFASKQLRDDHNLVAYAITKSDSAFRYASFRLRENGDLALAAVTKNPAMFEFAGNRVNPERFFAPVISSDCRAMQSCKCYIEGRGYIKLREDYQFMFKAVTKKGSALQYASKELQNNLTLVLAAVTQNGYAIQYASKELRAHPEVIEAARRR